MIKTIINFTHLNLNFLLKNKIAIISLFFFPSIAIVMSTVIFPVSNALGAIYLLGLIAPLGIIFGSTTFSFRNSTLYKASNLTSNSSALFYLSSLFFMIIIGYGIMIFISVIFIIFANFNILIVGYGGISPDSSKEYFYNFIGIQWSGIVVAVTEIILIMFSYSFVAKCFIQTEKSYYILILIFVILSVLLGGAFNSYINSASSSLDGINVEDDIYTTDVSGTYGDEIYFFFGLTGVFPLFMFIPSLLFPFYGPGQLINNVAWQASYEISSNGGVSYMYGIGKANIWSIPSKTDLWFPYWNKYAVDNWAGNYNDMYKSVQNGAIWVYPLILISPFFHVLGCSIVGIPASLRKRR